jgi:L-ribulokinase
MKTVIGLDFGTDTCRALVVDAGTGAELASAVVAYKRWKQGLYCDPLENRYRQHPLDYIEAFEESVCEALAKCPAGTASTVVGLSFDTTGSTPALIDADGQPLALRPEFADNPNAMFVLWKDHTAIREAARVNELAAAGPIDYTAYEGGIYSSEWVWAKMAHVLKNDDSLLPAACSWVEHCDWMPALVTGKTHPQKMIRSRCAAGHKAMWHPSWCGLPSENFLTKLEPRLKDFRWNFNSDTRTADHAVGTLTAEWAARLGLPQEVVAGAGAFDCHLGAVGAGIEPRTFVRVIGTSTCDIMVVPNEDMPIGKLIPGICGQVDGSVLPGMIGLEAGQSAFGDIYAWFRSIVAWPLENILAKSQLLDPDTKEKLIAETFDAILPALSEAAMRIPMHESAVIAVDWMNGRRTPDANQWLKGSITGLTLGSSAPMIFRALVEATAFGSKAIVDRFLQNDIAIEQVTAIGGISQKSPFVMQTLADVLGMPIRVAAVEHACAFGAAIFAATAAGVYPDVDSAQKAMNRGFSAEYLPDENRSKAYAELYGKYLSLGEFTEKNLFATPR